MCPSRSRRVAVGGEAIYAACSQGDFFGEVACLQRLDEPELDEETCLRRTASVRASCRSQLWSLSRKDLLHQLGCFPPVRDALLRTGSERAQATSTWLACRLGTLFSDIIRDADRGSFFAQLAPCMQPMRACKGDYLIRQGELNDDLFFLLQGEVRCSRYTSRYTSCYTSRCTSRYIDRYTNRYIDQYTNRYIDRYSNW